MRKELNISGKPQQLWISKYMSDQNKTACDEGTGMMLCNVKEAPMTPLDVELVRKQLQIQIQYTRMATRRIEVVSVQVGKTSEERVNGIGLYIASH